MGTRADFYVRHSETDLEWLGSIAWDGYEIEDVADAEDQQAFRQRLSRFLESRNDATYPDRGWPWPWLDSRLTDHAYVWVDGIGVVRRDGDDYPPENIGGKNGYRPDDGKCDAYVSLRREAELHQEADRDGEVYHPLWNEDTGFQTAASVDVRYIYPDMSKYQNVRTDEGSGVIFLG